MPLACCDRWCVRLFYMIRLGQKALHNVTIGEIKPNVIMQIFSARTGIKTLGNNRRVVDKVHAPFEDPYSSLYALRLKW